ncbi:MAG: ABC transporter ATP-binding protein [Bacteroidetes bacterium]|nr:ABC transporter ATP-binding protein [Bacteroidota bacterium]
MPASVIVENISKKFGETIALDSISFEVNAGELFGFIGPDGAGKTTLFRILTTLLLPGSGLVAIEGMDIVKDFRKIRDIMGYMPGRFSLYQDLTVEENLRFFAGIFKTTPEANYDLVKDIYSQIEPFKKRRAGKLSGGMKQKLALSCALIHRPKVLILDEPTTGVDAVSRKEFWEMLNRLKKTGISILVSTPYMDEASLCDRVALIQAGKLLSIDTPEAIISKFSNPLWAVHSRDLYSLLGDLRQFEATRTAFLFGQHIHLTVKGALSQGDLKLYLESKGHSEVEIKQIAPSIEDCFMELMV